MATIFNPDQLLPCETAPKGRPFLLVSKACEHDPKPLAEMVAWNDDLRGFIPCAFRYRLEQGVASDELEFIEENAWHFESPRPWNWIDVDFSQVF
jgi:hypothetical protein